MTRLKLFALRVARLLRSRLILESWLFSSSSITVAKKKKKIHGFSKYAKFFLALFHYHFFLSLIFFSPWHGVFDVYLFKPKYWIALRIPFFFPPRKILSLATVFFDRLQFFFPSFFFFFFFFRLVDLVISYRINIRRNAVKRIFLTKRDDFYFELWKRRSTRVNDSSAIVASNRVEIKNPI